MAQTSIESGSSPAPGLFARAIGVMFSPAETFRHVAARPGVLGAMLLVALVGAITIGGFLFTEVGQRAWLDAAVERQESWGSQVSDQQYAGMERMARFAGYIGVGQMLIFVPLIMVVISGIAYAVFNAALGGEATFKQVLAITAHSSIVSAVGWLFVMPLNYVRESMSSPTNLAALLPMLIEGSFVASFLGTIDVFLVWWVTVLAIGMAVLYRRKTTSVATSFFTVYAIIAIIIAVVKSSRGGA